MADHPRIELIHWIDSESGLETWTAHDEVVEWSTHKFALNETVGFFVGEEDNSVVLAQSWNNDEYGPHIKIPKACIDERRVLE